MAESVITVGGYSVILAVLGICVYLVAQVVPLFRAGRIEPGAVLGSRAVERPAFMVTDEYARVSAVMSCDGRLVVTLLALPRINMHEDGTASTPRLLETSSFPLHMPTSGSGGPTTGMIDLGSLGGGPPAMKLRGVEQDEREGDPPQQVVGEQRHAESQRERTLQ